MTLGDFRENFYDIVDMSNGDLLIEYASAYEFEAARVRLNGQVSMRVLTWEEAAALAPTAVREYGVAGFRCSQGLF